MAAGTELSELVDYASQLISAAGNLTLEHFGSSELEVQSKADGSPVTAADLAAEEFIRNALERDFPDDAIVGEEFGSETGTSGRQWFIDPIDGTRSFARGVPLFTNLLAIVDEDGPCVGVVNAPAAGELLVAGRGLGCTHNGAACRVSGVSDLADAVLTTSGYDYWRDDSLMAIKSTGARMVTWGDGYGYILVATGRAEAMIDPGLNAWDVMPMNIVIPEAGGKITNFAGDDQPAGGDVLGSNGLVHAELLAVLG